MNREALHNLTSCPSCLESASNWEWITWCSKCGTIVCSNCADKVHDCRDGYHFEAAGRGTRYFNKITLHEESCV